MPSPATPALFAAVLLRAIDRRRVRRRQVRALLQQMAESIAEAIAPPPAPRSVYQFAKAIRIGENPEHERAYDPDSHPAQRAILQAMSSGKWKVFVIIGPAQDGKTLAALVIPTLHTLVELRRPLVLAAPEMRISNDLWNDKVLATLEESGWGDLLPDAGAGSDSGTAPSLQLRTGGRVYRLSAGSRTQSGQAGRTAWAVIFTEYSDIDAKKATKLRQRTKGQGDDYLEIVEGTLKHSHNDETEKLYERRSTRGTIALPCAGCGSYWVPDWFEHCPYDDSGELAAQESVRLACPTCGHCHTDAERREQVLRGVYVMAGQTVQPDGTVVGDEPATIVWGIRWGSLQSPRKSMARLAADYVAAKQAEDAGDTAPMETLHQDDLAIPYENQARTLRLREMELARRSASALYPLRCAPPLADANLATCAIDVQHRSLYFMGTPGHTHTRSWWISDHGREAICYERETPTRAQVWQALDRVYERLMDGWARPDGSLLRPFVGGVDVRDGTNPHRDAIIEWVLAHPGMYCLQGQGGRRTSDSTSGTAVLRLPGVLSVHMQNQASPPFPLLMINVDTVKGNVVRDLARAPGEDGAGHLPLGEAADGWLIKELTAEVLEETDTGPKWVPIRRDNHRFDLATYNHALRSWWIHDHAHGPGGQVSAEDLAAQIAGGSHA